MFDGTPFARTTPLLMYVWAGNESVGNVYPSPYSDQAATIVLRSGDVDSGEWFMEERDVSADFERYFGRPAERVTGGRAHGRYRQHGLASHRLVRRARAPPRRGALTARGVVAPLLAESEICLSWWPGSESR